MARPRLSDAEREARRRARVAASFSDAAYRHYNPATEGYGSVDDWLNAAEAFASAKGVLGTAKPRLTGRMADLATLGFETMPADVAALKRGFRNAMFVAHPDYGGTNEEARACIEAYQRLLDAF